MRIGGVIYVHCYDHPTLSCCSSCHEDADYGYHDLLNFSPPDKDGLKPKNPKLIFISCCRFIDHIADLDRKGWAQLLREIRRAGK